MELLVHLNKRIKSRPKIQLPVETLLVQYQDPAAASFVTVRRSFNVQSWAFSNRVGMCIFD